MQVKKFEDHYKVKSESSNRWYEVFPDRPFCTCPNFLFRSMKGGGICKHLAAVQSLNTDGDADIINFVRENGAVDSLMLIEKFGELKVDSLIQRGELFEKAGKIRILE